MVGNDTASLANSEWLTRRKLIDPQLKAAGWTIVEQGKYDSVTLTKYDRCALVEYPTEHGPADYALCVGGRLLGIVEAKKLSLGPQNVLTQAERYSRGVTANPFDFGGCRVPFLYATNGEVIWHHDICHSLNRSRQITQFHTPNALVEKLNESFADACQALLNWPNSHDRLRPYQVECNTEIEKAIANRRRQMLVAMATGTGKTFTMVNEIYRLMKSGVGKRILFLVDRRALAAQAVRAFAAFEPEAGLKFNQLYEVYSQRFQTDDFGDEDKFDPKVLPNGYLTDPKPGHAFVYVSTIQRMTINLFGKGGAIGVNEGEEEEDASQLDIPTHAFDVIVADECHRGYTASELATWRATLDHFDAIKIGLTATPAAHTTTYFKDVVYRYEYERAVREGHLVDYDVVSISSEVRMNGAFLDEGELVGVVDTETGAERMDYLEDEREFKTTELENRVTVPDSNQKILGEIKKYADEHEARYGRFPKTLIFAANDLPHTSHADQLVDMARDLFGRGDKFVAKITGRVDRPLQRIREFRNRPEPGIVVTVDLLSTGVDIPDLEFIVFLRPVKSRILFEQMLGRGTRKGNAYALDKSHFTVFDCFDGTLFVYFRNATAITASKPLPPARTLAEIIDDIWHNRDRDYNVRCLVKRLQRIDKEMDTAKGREAFAPFVADGDLGRFAAELPGQLKHDFDGTMVLLRNQTFQKLLTEYPRPERTFFKGYEVEDQVSSTWLVRDVNGEEYKPEDYLTVFSEFVVAKRHEIEAIGILLDHPRDWRPEALTELRFKLAATSPLNFSEDKLRRAHELAYHKAMVDIISMVKHAAIAEEELCTAEQRVERALTRIRSTQEFTADQEQWLEYIRVHMIENLSIDQTDFDIQPKLSGPGGWGKANRVFGGKLDELVKHLNEAVAA